MPATIYRPPTIPRTNRQCLLQLPPEIWQDIFHFATAIPQYSYGPEVLLSPMSKDSIRMYRVHLKTRSRLVLVCKAWRSATLGIQYESIFLADLRAILMLCRTLEASHRQDMHPLGSYTRALVIRVPHALHYQEQIQISSIIRCLPNLRYFGFSMGKEHGYNDRKFIVDKSIIISLCESCPDLEVIEAKANRGVSFSANTWPYIFQSLRKLRSFTTPHVSQLDIHDEPSQDTSYEDAAPLLSYLHVRGAPTNFFKYLPPSMPSLRVLVYDIYTGNRPLYIQQMYPVSEIRSMLPVLEAHGRQLTTIILRAVYYWGPHVSAAFRGIEEHCPHLETLIVLPVCLSTKAPPEPLILPSSVTRLCLRTCSNHQPTSNREFKALFAALAEMRVGKLTAVRLTDERSVLALQTTHQKALRYAHSVFVARGWRFEGPDGELVA
ncbi:hypothetical protein BDZ89DRAFT_1043195 [Hymenopellis radicata]|nr:hypothetical protein BDZ89DRAFT_1043195 [Hymenopellis radicata]